MKWKLGIQTLTISHIIGWVIFIIYEVSFVELIRGDSIDVSVWRGYVLPYCINISLFYFHAYVTMQRGIGQPQKSIPLFILLLIGELVIYLFVMGLKSVEAWPAKSDLVTQLYPSRVVFIQQLWRAIYFIIFSTAFWLIDRSFKSKQKLKEAETKALLRQQEKKELQLQLISAQHAFQQAQINPHLLFNMLNFIHSEVLPVSEKASEAIITLSDIMRYSLTDIKTDGKVILQKEVEQIENLIKLNQFRFEKQQHINLHTEGDLDTVRIAPLLLVPFVENLFKYAALTNEAVPAQISIKLIGQTLQFETHNQKGRSVHFHSPGIGIANVRTRLHSCYPDRFSLNIKDTATFFSVHLIIEL